MDRQPGPTLPLRGTIEGFYGPPWSHDQRRQHLVFAAAAGFDTFVYAPKDDPYHRRRWREPYPPAELARIAELAAVADANGIRFVYALHPALSMRFADDAEHAALAAKAAQLHGAGVRAFSLLFDDVPYELPDPGDAEVFGPGAGGLGAAHGTTVARFADGFLRAQGVPAPLLVCPTDYAGTASSAYRDALARTAPDDILMFWTGRDVVVGSVTRDEIDAAAASYRRPLVLWDNFPVNDYEPSRLFLGPLTGRTTDVDGSALVGIIANAMIQEAPSRIPLRTTAAWAADPAGYAAAPAHAAALAAEGATGLAPFVRVCSAWPPGADQDPQLTAAVAEALAGESSALDQLSARLGELADCCRAAPGPSELVDALRPWLAGARATAEAGLAAVRLLRAAPGERVALIEETRAALVAAETHYANVLRPVVPPFVRAALAQVAPAPDDSGRPVALLIGADEVTREFLHEEGFAVRTDVPPETVGVVVVTKDAPVAGLGSLAAASVPVVAWGGLVELGMATSARTAMLFEGVDVVDPSSPLAAGLTGRVPLYRGPAYVAVAEVASSAAVVVRGPDFEGAPVVFRYAAGTPLVDGTPAPAERIGVFPTGLGPARWLLDDSGRALLAAALRHALASGRSGQRASGSNGSGQPSVTAHTAGSSQPASTT